MVEVAFSLDIFGHRIDADGSDRYGVTACWVSAVVVSSVDLE